MNMAADNTIDLSLWKEAKAWAETLPDEILDLPYDFLSDPSPNDQLVAAYCVCSGKYDAVTLLGRAGSGKTFVLKACRAMLLMLGCEVRVVASTGIAAKNAGGEGTINRFAGLKSGDSTVPQGYRDEVNGHWIRSSVTKRADEIVSNFDPRLKEDLVVFIDEAGMCSSEMLLLTYQILTRALPKRRIRFVLTGDFRQLLPIVKSESNLPWQTYTSLAFEYATFHIAGSQEVIEFGSLLVNGPFERGSNAPWRSIQISLVKNRRQTEGSWFAEALNNLGDGHDFKHPAVAPLLKRVWVGGEHGYTNFRTKEAPPNLVDAIHLYNTNKEVAAHNKKALEAARERGAEFKTYVAYIEPGEWTEDEILKEVSPVTKSVTLAVGCKFMVRVNIDANLTNGTVGVIKKLEATRILIELPNGEEYWVEEQNLPLPVNKRKNPVGKFVGIPGVLAHAMTPWKAQGLTIKEPMVYHLNQWYATHGLLYVVCSRVTEPEYLYLMVEKAKMLNKAVLCESVVRAFVQFAENNMFKALGEHDLVAYPPMWSKEGDMVWVRDHLVAEVDYVENPKATLEKEGESCNVYSKNGMVGVFVKDRAKMAQILLENDEAFQWFKANVKFVWFNPYDASAKAA